MTREGYGQAYQQGLTHTVRFLLASGVRHEAAEDIAQAAWLRGWERLGQLRDDRMLLRWVNKIALNCFRRACTSERDQPLMLEPAASGPSVDWFSIDVSLILRSCRARDRGLLEAHIQGSSIKDLAQETGASQTSIRVRLLRARRAARKAVLRCGIRPAKPFVPQNLERWHK
jgi:DNA-directed RNA polymerase specialized sigma24 family protein